MNTKRIIDTLRKRVPWQVAQKILSEHGILRGLGWDKTSDRLSKDELPKEQFAAVVGATKEHLICGEKYVSFFKLDPAEMDKLRQAAAGWKVADNAFTPSYPASLEEHELGAAPRSPQLTAIERTDDGVAVVFSSVRTITVRESVAIESLPEAASDALSGFDEIVGLKSIRLQAADVVWLPHDGEYIDIRIDFPKGMYAEVADVAAAKLCEAFNQKAGYDALLAPQNLFPLINRIYTDATEGYVVELGFGTTTASLKQEKMRRKSSDLRKEPYHMGGKGALTSNIYPHRLSVAWDLKIDQNRVSSPELDLHANTRIAAADNPQFSAAVVRKCMGYADYEHVRSRIEKHLRS